MERAKESLSPYIRPRDEVAHIRRVLGAHLDSCLNIEGHRNPLALVGWPGPISPTPDIRGLQREYLKTLNANIQARREHEALTPLRSQDRSEPSKSTVANSPCRSTRFLDDHILVLKLRKKQQRLQAVGNTLERLNQMPPGSPDFLDPDEIFKDAPPLPEMPKGTVSGFVLDKTISKTNLDELLDRLQKSVLRAKLLLRREEQMLDEVKKRSPEPAGVVDDSAKLNALTVTRDELIAWMETELANASGDGVSDDADQCSTRAKEVAANRELVEEKVSAIKQKYGEYVKARGSLLHLISQSGRPALKPQPEDTETQRSSLSNHTHTHTSSSFSPASFTYLLSPYLEKLLSVAHEQKSLILQKSHLNVVLAKQAKDICQTLDHIAEESQLLPKYPMKGHRSRRQPGLLGDGSGVPADPTLSTRSKRWVFAAESAKISTLETVAEKTEEGEMALEEATKNLEEIDLLLGRQTSPESLGGEVGSSDIWLPEDQLPTKAIDNRRQKERAQAADIWSILDGDLGLIHSERDDG